MVALIFIVLFTAALVAFSLKNGNKQTNGHDDGSIKGEYKFSVNGYEVGIPINTSVQQIKEREQKAIERERETILKYGNASVIDLGDGKVRVKWSYLNKRFSKGAVIDEDLFWSYNGVDKYVDISKDLLEKMEKKRAAYMKRERTIQRISTLNNKGIELEKQGEIEEAIKIYEKNISYGDCDAAHPYDRLVVLYRKKKDYNNEKRVIELAINMLPFNREKHEKRLEKVNLLIEKSRGNVK